MFNQELILKFKRLCEIEKIFGQEELIQAKEILSYFMKEDYENLSEKKIIKSLDIIIFRNNIFSVNPENYTRLTKKIEDLRKESKEEIFYCLNYHLLVGSTPFPHSCKYVDIDEIFNKERDLRSEITQFLSDSYKLSPTISS
ncbi:MAG: hypothetical protein QW273_00975 [Candidatus Pacearchaeota archaeon]